MELIKLTQDEIKQKARHAFFDAVEAISELPESHLFDVIEWDADTMKQFSVEMKLLKLQFARGDLK